MIYRDIDKDDNVFHLSLTEIAFLIILALVLLLGFPLGENLVKNENLSQQLNDLKICKLLPEDPKVDPERPESRLYPCDRCVATRYDISLDEARRVQEIGRAASIYLKDEGDITPEKIEKLIDQIKSSNNLMQKIEDLTNENQKLQSYYDENEILKSKNTELVRENKELSGVNIRLSKEKERLENKLYYGGDFPPCMQGQTHNASGRISKWDNIFRLYMKEDRVYVTFANDKTVNHPAIDDDLRKMAIKIVEQSTKEEGLSWGAFNTMIVPIARWAERRNPQCRLAVLLENRIKGRKEGDARRIQIERDFYKQEIAE